MTRLTFPSSFLWGAATAAYQIEGSPLADGATPSIWHEWSHRRGKIKDGTNGDVACDHFRLWRDDIRQMKDLGLKAYRFSVSWPRIFPEPGRLNRKGLDFYSQLVDGLLEAGIEPWVTLFHWDTPVWLEKLGGFIRRESVDHMVEYGSAVFRHLGDRVGNWLTVNEPSAYATAGYVLGIFPPGRKRDLTGMYHSSHHLLLGHARLHKALHAQRPGARIGLALSQADFSPRHPDRERDRKAAEFLDAALNRFYCDPLLLGSYPAEPMRKAERHLPPGFVKDLDEMKRTADFIGINYYYKVRVKHSFFQPYTHAKEHKDPGAPRSAMWEISAKGISNLLLRYRDDYGNPPVYITENGYPLQETAGRDTRDDQERIAYLGDHIAEVGRALQQGADCRGYFHWTLMDNFEWLHGHTMPFGLLRTDFVTQERQWRSSATWYRDLIRRGWMEVA
jgi:beta-glucosidase